MVEQGNSVVNPNEADGLYIELKGSMDAELDLNPEALSPWPVSWDDVKVGTEEAPSPEFPLPMLPKQKRSSSRKYKVTWSKEEDELLYKSYLEYGMNWKKISEIIKGKSCYLVKKRFYDIIYDGENFQNCLSPSYFSKRKARFCESLTEKQKLHKMKQLCNRMLTLQKFINETKQKLYHHAEQSFPMS